MLPVTSAARSFLMAAVVVASFATTASAQSRSGGVMPAIGITSGPAGPVILQLNGELGITGSLGAFVTLTSWTPGQMCAVDTGFGGGLSSECSFDPYSIEIGARYTISPAPRVAPFVGLGSGVYFRDGEAGLLLQGAAGLDLGLAPPLVLRLAVRHREMLFSGIEDLYDDGVRFTSGEVGLGLLWW